jgi:hypothetical protein
MVKEQFLTMLPLMSYKKLIIFNSRVLFPSESKFREDEIDAKNYLISH